MEEDQTPPDALIKSQWNKCSYPLTTGPDKASTSQPDTRCARNENAVKAVSALYYSWTTADCIPSEYTIWVFIVKQTWK